MKTLTLLLLILLFVPCKAQYFINGHKIDTAGPSFTDTCRFVDSFDPRPIRFDTIQVILLVTNTDKSQANSAYYIYGYEVKEKWRSPDNFYAGSPIYTWIHYKYLDAKKQDFPDNIVVWMSKDRK